MRRFLPLSLGGQIIIAIPLIAYTLVRASPEPGAPAHWSVATNISNSSLHISGPRIAAQEDGILQVVWIDGVVDPLIGNGNLFYKKSEDQGSSWSNGEQLTSEEESYRGNIVLGPNGTVHLVWIERESFQNFSVEYAAKASSGSWVTSTVAGPAFQQEPAIGLGENYIYIVWQKVDLGHLNIWYSYKPITITITTWAEPQLIMDTIPGSFAPDVSVDSQGNAHVVWQEDVNEGAIWYSKGSWNGTFNWSGPITLSEGLTGCVTPAIAVGSDNYVHIVWGRHISDDEQYVYYANFPHNDPGSITTPVQVFTEAVGVSTEAPTYLYPRLAIRGDSEIHVVWHGKAETDITDQIWYAVSQDKGSSWSSPIKISREATRQGVAPDIALDGEMGHVVWQGKDESDRYQVMYSRGFPYAVYLPMVTKSYSGG